MATLPRFVAGCFRNFPLRGIFSKQSASGSRVLSTQGFVALTMTWSLGALGDLSLAMVNLKPHISFSCSYHSPVTSRT